MSCLVNRDQFYNLHLPHAAGDLDFNGIAHEFAQQAAPMGELVEIMPFETSTSSLVTSL